MIQFDLPKERSSIIKVIGVGGGGGNAVNHMFSQNIEGVDFVICNTDSQALAQSRVPNKIQLGPLLTQGLGAGANPDIGRQACEESLEEIRGILEVNTKMAFITAGMGGGTGTGGAPILAKICRDLGVLTVGIVTTPFSYEGKKRQLQADEGIQLLKQYVDTLLVISNDKLRHQYGNLKLKEAFQKADNVLATAAKCITDVINSTGQINVDFADVCTVMRSGGVAILGSAVAAGNNRAQSAIEEALNSPLLNDNEIRGAKWILININSAAGEHEFTMDEVEIIQQHLVSQAGEDADVIMGLGYDNTLGDKIGITIIATGFEYRDPFEKKAFAPAQQDAEKVVMPLKPQLAEQSKAVVAAQSAAQTPAGGAPAISPRTATEPLLKIPEIKSEEKPIAFQYEERPVQPAAQPVPEERVAPVQEAKAADMEWVLAPPRNIYEEEAAHQATESGDMQMVYREPAASEPPRAAAPAQPAAEASQPEPIEDADMLRRRAAERISKLRNLSFNVHGTDPNNEYDTVPAYIRRNLDLSHSGQDVENFYSNYEVKSDGKTAEISTINTFLDGKKPD